MKKAFIIGIIFSFIFTGIAIACEQPVQQSCEELQNCITPSPEVSPTVEPEVTPVASESATPTVQPPPGNVPENPGDGRNDGLSSCPSCTAAPTPTVVIPSFPPDTGRGS